MFDRSGRAKITILKEGRREGGRGGGREGWGRGEVMIPIREPIKPTPTKRKTMVRACSIGVVGEKSPN